MALHGREHRRPRAPDAPVAEEQLARVGDAAQTAVGHLEQPELAGGAEAVLHGTQEAEGVVALALETEHGVDHVLEHPGPGQGAVLGHVPDQDGREGAGLGQGDQRVGARLDLGHRAGGSVDVGVEDGLDAVDDQHIGGEPLDTGGHPLQGGLGHDPHAGHQRARAGPPAA